MVYARPPVAADSSTLATSQHGSGEPLVLINGYAASKADWDPTFVAALAESSTVICPDNRGIGQSPPLEGELTIASMAEDVLAAMDAHRIRSADLVGWSMGGFVAQELAARAPERVRGLALLSTDGGGRWAVRAPAEVWARLIDHSGTPREQATRLLKLLFPPRVADQIDAEFGDVVAGARAALSPTTLFAQEAAMDRWHKDPASERLEGIFAPTFIAAGTADAVIPSVNSKVLADALAGPRHVLFEGGGHAFMAQEPERLAAAINDWFGR
jgi:pimeloyl-ACP methyl ester carboxylesterase